MHFDVVSRCAFTHPYAHVLLFFIPKFNNEITIRAYNQLFENNKKVGRRNSKGKPGLLSLVWRKASRLNSSRSAGLTAVFSSTSYGHPSQATFLCTRNIANMVIHTDISMLSVLDSSVNVLGVEHILVCGHYGCGGVITAMGNKQVGLIDNYFATSKTFTAIMHRPRRVKKI